MSVRKKADKFGRDLRNVMMHHAKLDPDVMGYVLAAEIVAFYTQDDPHKGLNDMIEVLGTAAGDQGYRMVFQSATMH